MTTLFIFNFFVIFFPLLMTWARRMVFIFRLAFLLRAVGTGHLVDMSNMLALHFQSSIPQYLTNKPHLNALLCSLKTF